MIVQRAVTNNIHGWHGHWMNEWIMDGWMDGQALWGTLRDVVYSSYSTMKTCFMYDIYTDVTWRHVDMKSTVPPALWRRVFCRCADRYKEVRRFHWDRDKSDNWACRRRWAVLQGCRDRLRAAWCGCCSNLPPRRGRSCRQWANEAGWVGPGQHQAPRRGCASSACADRQWDTGGETRTWMKHRDWPPRHGRPPPLHAMGGR